MRKITKFLIFLLPIFVFAIPPLKEVEHYPKSYLRDFYLTEYLKKSKTYSEAKKIYSKITHKKWLHQKIMARKFKKYRKIYNCQHPSSYNFKYIKFSCILKHGFNLASVLRMKKKDVKILLSKLPKNSKLRRWINIIFKRDYEAIFKNKKLFFKFFIYHPRNVAIPPKYLNALAKDWRFTRFLSIVVRKRHFDELQNSLLHFDWNRCNDKSKFLLALNALNHNFPILATEILKTIQKKDNRTLFWLYLLTKDKIYAEKLLKRKRINFYSMFLYEKFHKKYHLDEVKIFNSAPKKYDINNPLDVLKFKRELAKRKDYFKFAKELDNKEMLPLKVVVLERAFHFTKNYYIMPKYDLKGLNTSTKALLYGLARQESQFIPAQISHSYAIGLMQLMPFLIRSFHPKEDISQFFDAKVNVKYAKKHLSWLVKTLHHPLFVAYAYNGGVGFVKKKVIPYFKFQGKYEPFLSMEMVPYRESRKYGKKVLANYVIYYNKLNKSGEKITLHKLLHKK